MVLVSRYVLGKKDSIVSLYLSEIDKSVQISSILGLDSAKREVERL